MSRTIRTALDRANDDLAAAEKRATKAADRDTKARKEASAARAEKDAADREVTAYGDLVRTLGGNQQQPTTHATTTGQEPTQ